jgi:hypothetical protein
MSVPATCVTEWFETRRPRVAALSLPITWSLAGSTAPTISYFSSRVGDAAHNLACALNEGRMPATLDRQGENRPWRHRAEVRYAERRSDGSGVGSSDPEEPAQKSELRDPAFVVLDPDDVEQASVHVVHGDLSFSGAADPLARRIHVDRKAVISSRMCRSAQPAAAAGVSRRPATWRRCPAGSLGARACPGPFCNLNGRIAAALERAVASAV